jgi:predicted DNA-binding ribbon-helix-helix protein
MCSIFSDIDPKLYASESRSVRLGGHVTSIRLEASFWRILEEIAATQEVSVGRLLTKLHDEVLAVDSGSANFASLLRCACLAYLSRARGNKAAEAELAAAARRDFSRREKLPARPAA